MRWYEFDFRKVHYNWQESSAVTLRQCVERCLYQFFCSHDEMNCLYPVREYAIVWAAHATQESHCSDLVNNTRSLLEGIEKENNYVGTFAD